MPLLQCQLSEPTLNDPRATINNSIAAPRHRCCRCPQELGRDLRSVRDQLRQVAARKKNLQDLNDQLDVPLSILLDPNVPPEPPGPPAAPGGEATLGWRTQRLECLMYRVLWVAEAIKMFKDNYAPHSGSRSYGLFLRASSWAKGLRSAPAALAPSPRTFLQYAPHLLAVRAAVQTLR